MQPTPEISIDLTAQELLELPSVAPIEADDICEFEDIGEVDPLLRANAPAANEAAASPEGQPEDQAHEIELTVEQIDLVLRGRPFR